MTSITGDTGEIPVQERRDRGWRVGEIRNSVTTLLQIGALIYGIAKFTTTVDALKDVVADLKTTVKESSQNTNRVEIQQAKQEGAIQAIKDMLKASPR
jgi:hypothetical protein